MKEKKSKLPPKNSNQNREEWEGKGERTLEGREHASLGKKRLRSLASVLCDDESECKNEWMNLLIVIVIVLFRGGHKSHKKP